MVENKILINSKQSSFTPARDLIIFTLLSPINDEEKFEKINLENDNTAETKVNDLLLASPIIIKEMYANELIFTINENNYYDNFISEYNIELDKKESEDLLNNITKNEYKEIKKLREEAKDTFSKINTKSDYFSY